MRCRDRDGGSTPSMVCPGRSDRRRAAWPARAAVLAVLVLLSVLDGAAATAATASAATFSYPVNAFYVPVAQAAGLQRALDTYQVVRLDPGSYANAGTLVMHSNYRLYGLGSQVGAITIAPGTSNAIVCNLVGTTITFPPSASVSQYNMIKGLRNATVVATNATLSNNLFMNCANGVSFAISTVGGGALINNRFIRTVDQGPAQFISMVGDAGRSSYGNVFLFVNCLDPQMKNGVPLIQFANQGDLTLVGCDIEQYAQVSASTPLISVSGMPVYRSMIYSGSCPHGVPLQVDATEYHSYFQVINDMQGTAVLRGPDNLRSLDVGLHPMGTNDITTQPASGNAFHYQTFCYPTGNGMLAPATTINGVAQASTITGQNSSLLAGMLQASRTEVPWELPVYPTPPDPAGPSWNQNLSGRTDASAMINGLIASAKAAGRFAILPPGVYYIAHPILLGGDNGLIGSGMATTAIVGMNSGMDLITGDGTPGLNISDLTLEGGANGMHFTDLNSAGSSSAPAQFTQVLFSHITFRNCSHAALFLDGIFGWDNTFIDETNVVGCANGFLQLPNAADSNPSGPDICYVDKTVFYHCQFIGCGEPLSMHAGRADNLNMWIDCLFQDNTVSAADLGDNNEPVFANCDFNDNAGAISVNSQGGSLMLISDRFLGGPLTQGACFFANDAYAEGCAFQPGSATTGTIVPSTYGPRNLCHFLDCASTIPLGDYNDGEILLLNTNLMADTGLNLLAESYSGGSVRANNTVITPTALSVQAAQPAVPSPELLVGSRFPASFTLAIAGGTSPALSIGPPMLPNGQSAVSSQASVTIPLTYPGTGNTISLTAAQVVVTTTGTATATATVSGSGSTQRTVTLSGFSGNGTVAIGILPGSATDAFGNAFGAAGPSQAITVLTSQPTVQISSPLPMAPVPTAQSPIPLTITFSAPVTGFSAASPMVVANGTISGMSGAGGSYTCLLTPGGNGTVSVAIPAGVAVDDAGNPSLASPTASFVYTTAGPSATIALAPGQSPTTTALPIAYTASFTQPVTSLPPSAIVLGGSASGALVESVTPLSGNAVFSIQVGGPLTPGTVTAAIAPDAVVSLSSNLPSSGAPATNDTVVYAPAQTSAIAEPAASSSSSHCGSGIFSFILVLGMACGLRRLRA